MGLFSTPGGYRQLTAAIVVNITTFMNGVAMGWLSPTVPYLKSNSTTITPSPMTDTEISWMTGATSIGAIMILPFCGMMSERLGRKLTGCLIAIPFFISWLLKIIANNYIYLVVARLLVGFSAALCGSLVPIYVSEISSTSIRGQLGSFLIFALNIGIVSGYVLGAVFSYTIFASLVLFLPVIFFGLFLFMPETPVYLVRKNRSADATRSLMWLMGNNESAAKLELRRLQTYVKENVDVSRSVGFRDLVRDRGTIKGFIIALVLFGAQETTGYSVMMTYTSEILTFVDGLLTPNSATIIVGIIQIFGSWLSIAIMDRAGRRSLILISCLGMAICHGTLSAFFFMEKLPYDLSSLTWIPVTALSIYAFVWSFGIGPISFIVASEIFSADVSSTATSIALEFMWIISFLTMKFYPWASLTIGKYGCFSIFGFFSLFTFIFTYFIVPETKGRSIDSIVNELNGFPEKKEDRERLEVDDMI
ncbi:facilitated trehalose transporter Tret1 [Fopius arisanus]|uniref:Facilitated trehalose transporter Tret1 n=1 Tax=Fopius arisanus TaxID=64838 RepID=A0A0C9RQR2_9HYME|nr:PREDICTED: facilitated trehalose transporter Tret1-like [Fopius arisanus]